MSNSEAAAKRCDSFLIGHSRRRRAFTLIELILVMALLAIVMAVSAPALSNFFRGRTLGSEARRFLSLTRYAQSRAVTEGVPMVLWMDIRRGKYGLQQEPGYSTADTKAVDFVLGQDLKMAIADVPAVSSQSSQARQMAQADGNVPRLHFQPDGFVSDASPRSVELRESRGESIWITLSRSRMNYELHDSALQNALH
jgi:type II secretion system protein H